MQPKDNIAKLYEHCGEHLSEAQIAQIVDTVMKLENLKGPQELLDLFVKED